MGSRKTLHSPTENGVKKKKRWHYLHDQQLGTTRGPHYVALQNMRKSIISTVVVAALAGTTGAAYAFNQNLSGHTVEQRDAVEAAFDKKALINDAIKVGNDQIRVIIQLQDVPMAQFAPINPMMRADN